MYICFFITFWTIFRLFIISAIRWRMLQHPWLIFTQGVNVNVFENMAQAREYGSCWSCEPFDGMAQWPTRAEAAWNFSHVFTRENTYSTRTFDIIDLNKYLFNIYFNMAFYILNICYIFNIISYLPNLNFFTSDLNFFGKSHFEFQAAVFERYTVFNNLSLSLCLYIYTYIYMYIYIYIYNK